MGAAAGRTSKTLPRAEAIAGNAPHTLRAEPCPLEPVLGGIYWGVLAFSFGQAQYKAQDQEHKIESLTKMHSY
jgi:hypothetical protein